MDVPEISYHTVLESTPWTLEDQIIPQVQYIDHLTSYETFFQNILLKNQLCIIGPQATANWTSRKHWVMADGSPNFAYLSDNFGDSVAPVADCNAEEFCSHPKTEMTVKKYLTYWQHYRSQGHRHDARCLYLKDWHFTRKFPGYCAYTAPDVLCSDWMNEFWDVWKDQEKADDYRFVYMGPKQSWTPFHADVLYSYSWSANICGKKKWIFYPPGEEIHLKDKHGQLVFDLRSPDLQDLEKYPQASAASAAAITVIQHPGEIIFVPSGWHHQVFNLEDTISINHNWMNGCSAHLSWNYIKKRLLAVQREIEDCRDMEGWHQHCQVMLKADSGMDYIDFYNFIATVAAHRRMVLNLYIEQNSRNITHSFKHMSLPANDTCRHSGNVEKDGGMLAATESKTGLKCSGTAQDQLSCNCLDKDNQKGRRFIFLCLFQGVVVDVSADCDGHSVDDMNTSSEHSVTHYKKHEKCPHWAHCGPNLALFDLYRVLDIVQDMKSHGEFKFIMEEPNNQARFSVPPSELIVQIEDIMRQMTHD